MKVGKCIAGGVLTAAMICQSLYVPGGFGIETVKAAAANVALNKPATASGVESGVENCTPDKGGRNAARGQGGYRYFKRSRPVGGAGDEE